MSMHALMSELRQLKVRLWVQDGQLRYAAPPNAIDADLKRRMVENKAALMAAIDRAGTADADVAVAASPLPALASGPRRLSFAQQRLLFLHQMDPGSGAYHLPVAWRIQGPLDVDLLARSVALLPGLHEALRCGFAQVDGDYACVDVPAASLALGRATLPVTRSGTHEETLQLLLRQEALAPFALDAAPLLRATLVTLGPDAHVLMLTMHHLVSDGWSMDLLARDLWQLYGNGGQAPAPAAPQASYQDYIAAQARWAGEAGHERQKRYWVAQLAGLPALLDLPLDHPRPAVQQYHGAVAYFDLPPGPLAALERLAQSHGASLYMALLALFGVLLGRASGQHDLAIGTPMANRRGGQWETLVGFFTNVVVLRLHADPGLAFTALLEQVRDTALDAYEHQEFPFEQVVEHLQPQRSLSHSPLFQVMFILKEAARSAAPDGLSLAGLPTHNDVSKFDLTLTVERFDGGARAGFEYSTALFDAATMARMAEHLGMLLVQAVEHPGLAIGDLQLLTVAERAAEAAWNGTTVAIDRAACVHQLIEQRAAAMAGDIAVSFDDTDLSYGELMAQSGALAAELRQRGLGAESKVGIHIERSPQLVVALLGILRAGAAYVPLDPNYPADRLAYIAADAGLACIVTAGATRGRSPAPAVPMLALEDCTAALSGAPVPVCSDNAAYVIYTSGSTGQPKGVVVTHRNVVNLFDGLDRSLAPSLTARAGRPVWTALTSISFDISVLELLWTLARGHQVLLQRDHLGMLAQADAAPRRTAAAALPARSRALEFSLFYFAADENAQADKYRLLLDGARFADSHGFCAVWVPERHFHAFGGQFPNPAVAAAAVAAITTRVQVRAGSVVLPLHNPIRVAEEWSMVDNLSGGRAAVAFASGWHFNDFVLAPDNFADRHRVMRDGIETVRQLWAGQSIVQRDGLGNEARVSVRPTPVQKALPVWLTAAASPDTFRYAGEIGANVLTHLLGQSLPELRDKIAIYRAARSANGYDPDTGSVTLMLHTFVGEQLEAVREAVRTPFKDYLRTSINLLKPVAESQGLDAGNDLELVVEAGFNRYFATGALFGTPESCLPLLADVHAIGVDEIACLIDFGVDAGLVTDNLAHLDRLRRLASAPPAGEVAIRPSATHIQCTPSFAKMLLAQRNSAALGHIDGFLVGGEALSPALARSLREATGGHVFNMYGPTETTVWSAVRHLRDAETVLGAPISNTRLHVLDARMHLLPVRVAGELYIAGEGVTRGYWQRPDLTAERFLPDPFSSTPGARMYRTGDLVRRLDDGSIEFLGRVDHQVKVRGFRVELGEVEAALRSYPGVTDAVAVVRGAEEHEAAIVAYVTGTALERDALLAHAALALPGYMLPSAIVTLERLPLTPNGKVDRKALPAPGQAAAGQVRELARSDLERALSALWCELLQLDSVGINENFFELGGHSLLLGRMQQQMIARFDCEISIIELFKFPTIATLTALIGQRGRSDTAAEPATSRISEGQQAVQQMRQRMKSRKRHG